MTAFYTEEDARCPRCKKISCGLVPINDKTQKKDINDKRICRTCKKKIKKVF